MGCIILKYNFIIRTLLLCGSIGYYISGESIRFIFDRVNVRSFGTRL